MTRCLGIPMRKVCLIIIDGFGISPGQSEFDATKHAEHIEHLKRVHGFLHLKASGKYVGLPDTYPGNSEVGHMTIGAGRRITQSLLRINNSHASNELEKIVASLPLNRCVHLIGLCSDGGVHSHINHLKYLINALADKKIVVHAIADGIDTPPNTFWKYLNSINATVGSVSGRYYAMDRDLNHERTRLVYTMLTAKNVKRSGICECKDGSQARTLFEQQADKNTEEYTLYQQQGIADEYVPPTKLTDDYIDKNDTIIFFNIRADRMKQLVSCFSHHRSVFSLTEYCCGEHVRAMFKHTPVANTLVDYLSQSGHTLVRIAETEKYAHVTYFFNGGDDKTVKGETRFFVESPKVKSFSLAPGTSMEGVKKACLAAMQNGADFILANLAGPDLVGHSGVFPSVVKSVQIADCVVLELSQACSNNDYILMISADHGNAEQMVLDNQPSKSHTTNDVPFIFVDTRLEFKLLSSDHNDTRELADIAPTILEVMGLDIPKEMTGIPLVKKITTN